MFTCNKQNKQTKNPIYTGLIPFTKITSKWSVALQVNAKVWNFEKITGENPNDFGYGDNLSNTAPKKK